MVHNAAVVFVNFLITILRSFRRNGFLAILADQLRIADLHWNIVAYPVTG